MAPDVNYVPSIASTCDPTGAMVRPEAHAQLQHKTALSTFEWRARLAATTNPELLMSDTDRTIHEVWRHQIVVAIPIKDFTSPAVLIRGFVPALPASPRSSSLRDPR